jgi:hypothetical protein
MSMRKQFEAKHPVPEGVVFDQCSGTYKIEPGGISMQQDIYCLRWDMWAESRAAMVVELPRPFMSGYTESGNCPATDLYSFDDVKSAIEAAGGTVKP